MRQEPVFLDFVHFELLLHFLEELKGYAASHTFDGPQRERCNERKMAKIKQTGSGSFNSHRPVRRLWNVFIQFRRVIHDNLWF